MQPVFVPPAGQLPEGAGPGLPDGTEAQCQERAVTLGDAARLCRSLADALGADHFSLLFVAPQGESRRLAPVFDSDFPGLSLLSRSLSSKAAEGFARAMFGAAVPAWWRDAEQPPFLGAAARCWASEIANPGTVDRAGIAFPVSIERGRSGVVVFAGDAMAVDEGELCDAHARCFAIFADVARQRVQDCAKTPPVSKREVECLRLTANGLTSEDIAATLGLSVHTANQYLTNSTQKLNAVNRIHAVAKALRSGLID